MSDNFKIYQLKLGEEYHYLYYVPYDRLQKHGKGVQIENYDLVYSGVMKPGDTLNTLFEKFNINHPADFKGRSLSVSDIVVVEQEGKANAFYVDVIGFRNLTGFFKEPENEKPTKDKHRPPEQER